ncbi:prepilin-type N-terminal cleavage/methylation domain-containing protein, partial [Candidatus Thioglobus sp.]|nr:prepilin-type N-terminal cleavage/methylation domain-containing protein [Candidatus Thioglobus sp.]
MRHNKKAFTLVEMLVALAVSAVIVSATYASFELIKNQYKKNIDVTQLHTSGRAIMQVLEREIRMAGFEFRDGNGLMTYGKIVGPLVLTDSGNKCCDEVTIIYDEVTDTLNAQGVVTSSEVDRIKTRFWTEAYSSTKRGSRFRLFKRRTILGTNNALLQTPQVGAKEVMADYIEDLQLSDASIASNCDVSKVCDVYNGLKVHAEQVKLDQQN